MFPQMLSFNSPPLVVVSSSHVGRDEEKPNPTAGTEAGGMVNAPCPE